MISRGRVLQRLGVLFLALFAWPKVASADIGLPMLLLVWPGFGVLLIPIIALEAAYGRRLFSSGWKLALRLSGTANLVSTVLGIPLTWVFVVLLEIAILYPLSLVVSEPGPLLEGFSFIISAPWFLPANSAASWQLPLAAAILCVPFFFASVFVESRVARRVLPDPLKGQATTWAWGANLLSYVPIVAALLGCTAVFAFVIK